MLQRRKTRLFQQPHTLIGMSDRRTPVTIHGRILPEIPVCRRPGSLNNGRRTFISMPDGGASVTIHGRILPKTLVYHITEKLKNRRRTFIGMPDRTIPMHPARRTQTIPEHTQHIIQKRPLPGTP